MVLLRCLSLLVKSAALVLRGPGKSFLVYIKDDASITQNVGSGEGGGG